MLINLSLCLPLSLLQAASSEPTVKLTLYAVQNILKSFRPLGKLLGNLCLSG
jgi:hypothetical protein